MPIDLNYERPISFNEAADLLSQLLGARLAYKKVYTWSRFGFKKVVLEHVQIGKSLFTTREALGRFVRGILETSTGGRSFFHVEGVRGRAALASALENFEAEGALAKHGTPCGRALDQAGESKMLFETNLGVGAVN